MISRTAKRIRALLNSGTRPRTPGIYRFGARNVWLYTGDTRTEDKAPQGCDLSADSSAGMARGGFDAEVVPTQHQTVEILAYCGPKMVLTKGSTLVQQVSARSSALECALYSHNGTRSPRHPSKQFPTKYRRDDKRESKMLHIFRYLVKYLAITCPSLRRSW